MSDMDERIERAAMAGYEVTRQQHNAQHEMAYWLLPWLDEPEGLREDWRAFMRVALPAAFPDECAHLKGQETGSKVEG